MTFDPAESVDIQVFDALVELVENPTEPLAKALAAHFRCDSVAEILIRLVSVPDRDVQEAMEHEISDVIAGKSLHH